MQNRYAADIGDFSKYALLNALACDNFRLGVVWYFNTVEEPNRDGRFTEYAHLRECDPIIYDKLWDIRESRRRTLREIEKAAVLPCSTLFYREPVPVFANDCSTADTRRRQ